MLLLKPKKHSGIEIVDFEALLVLALFNADGESGPDVAVKLDHDLDR